MAEPQQPMSAYDALQIAQKDFVRAADAYNAAKASGNEVQAEQIRGFLMEADAQVLRLMPMADKEEKARKAPLLQSLSSGAYAEKPLVPAPGLQDPERPGHPLKNTIAEIYRTSPDMVDIATGLPPSIRREMSVARDPEQKMAILQNYVGDRSAVSPINISGSTNFVVRKGDGSLLLADEIGTSWGDLADVAADTARMTGEVGASVVASLASKRPVASSALASFLSNLVLGSGQDVAANKLSGRDADVVDEVLSQLPEAAVMGGTDYLGSKLFSMLPTTNALGIKMASGVSAAKEKIGDVVGRVSPRAGSAISRPGLAEKFSTVYTNQYAKSIDEAVKRLERQGITRDVPIGWAMRSAEATESQQVAAGVMRGSTLRKGVDKVLNDLADWNRVYLSGKFSSQAEFDKVLSRVQGEANVLFAELRNIDSKLARDAKSIYEQRTKEFLNGRLDSVQLGQSLDDIVKRAEAAETKLKNDAYDSFYNVDAAGVTISDKEAYELFKDAYDSAATQGLESPSVEAVVNRLEKRVRNGKLLEKIDKRISKLEASGKPVPESLVKKADELRKYSGPLDLRTFRNYMERLSDPIPTTGAVAQGTPVQSAAIASKGVSDYWDNLLAMEGLTGKWQQVTDKYTNDFLLFRRNSVGSIAKEHLGDSTLSPEAKVAAAIRDTRSVDDVLRAVQMENPANYDTALAGLQRAYLEKIGLTNIGEGAGKLNYDVNMLASLWGRKPDGSVSFTNGELMAEKLDRLAAAFKKSNLDPKHITADDINELAGITVSSSARDAAIKSIAARAQKQTEVENLLGKKMLSMAEKGRLEFIDNNEFAGALLKGNSDQIKRIMSLPGLSDREKNIIRQDFVAALMSRYQSNPYVARSGEGLWDAEKLLRQFETKKELERNARLVLGDEFIDNLKAASLVQKTLLPKTMQGGKIEIKGAVSGTGPSVYPVVPLTVMARKWFLAGAYGQGILQKMVRKSALSGVPIDPDQGFRAMSPFLFGTPRGVEALMTAGRNSPEFREWLAQISGQIQEEDRAFQEMQGEFAPPE